MAHRCGGQLVEAPSADAATMAFSNALRVMIFDGRRSSRTSSTMRRAGHVGHSAHARDRAAGIAAQPGQRHAERFGQRIHRQRGAHGVAVTWSDGPTTRR